MPLFITAFGGSPAAPTIQALADISVPLIAGGQSAQVITGAEGPRAELPVRADSRANVTGH